MPDRIFIVGCARSGTTLLRRLFHAFDGVEVIPHEVSLDLFVDMPPPADGKILIGKRTIRTLFSNCLPPLEGQRQLELIRARDDMLTLCIYRDGRDVVESEYAPPVRWIESIHQMITLGDAVRTLKYEDLVEHPDELQAGIAKACGLEPLHRWSEYPAFFPGDDHADIYPPQPIGAHRVGKDPTKWRRLDPWHAPKMERLLNCLGYLGEA